jgi:4-oxalocrotonate tautomerase
MPHVIVKMYAGRSEQLKAKLAEAITRAVMEGVNCGEDAVSVGIEDVTPEDWTARVYQPDIVSKSDTIYKKPGYGPD